MTKPCSTAADLIELARLLRREGPEIIPEMKRAEREHSRLGAEHNRQAAYLRTHIRKIRKAAKGDTP